MISPCTLSGHLFSLGAISSRRAFSPCWLTMNQGVRINRDQAGAGLILLSRGYRGFGNEKFGILDAFGNKVHRTPTNISERLLENEIATIEAELARIL